MFFLICLFHTFILQLEKDELEEFELLEMAAEECSFSSQCSLVAGILNKGNPLTLRPEIPQPIAEVPQSLLENGALPHIGAVEPVKPACKSDKPGRLNQNKNGFASNPEVATEDPFHNYPVRNENTPTSSPPYSAEEEDSDCSLDETLKPSLAAGVVFSDEETWESFTHGSPAADKGQRTVLNGAVTPERSTSWASPVKREQLDQWGRTIFSSPLPASSLRHHDLSPKNIHPKELLTRSPPLPTATMQKFENHPLSSSDPVLKPTLASLPPPSALVSKLFPALRRDREESEKQALSQMVTTSPSTPTSGPVIMKENRSPPASSPVVQVPMNEELKQKLCQLETEIERFRGENAALERLKREKKEVSIYTNLQLYR